MSDPDYDTFLLALSDEPTNWAVMAVYSDRLKEQGATDLGYAYRWAAKYEKHPAFSPTQPASEQWNWYNSTGHAALLTAMLPDPVFCLLRQGRWAHARFATPAEAFRALAKALRNLRDLVAEE